ncbi:MAG: type II secretion system protein GspN [Deltaproteobacteria bacterium]|nr:type II secretion system protein GspN [Deltaproteobacteria bacterium]
MTNTKKTVVYAVYIISVAVFFVYYLFPADTLKQYITFNLSNADPDLNIVIDDIKFSFPSGLALHDVSIGYLRNSLLFTEYIKITPGFFSFFRSKPVFFFKSKVCEGTLKGKIDITGKGSTRRIVIDADMADIRIKDIPVLRDLTGRNISGILDGKIRYDSHRGGGTAKTEFVLSACAIELLKPVFNRKAFAFKNIKADIEGNNKRVRIKKCDIKGDQMDGRVSGFITIKRPYEKSLLSLKGTIRPQPLFVAGLGKDFPMASLLKDKFSRNGIHFDINGTLDSPRFSLK